MGQEGERGEVGLGDVALEDTRDRRFGARCTLYGREDENTPKGVFFLPGWFAATTLRIQPGKEKRKWDQRFPSK